MKIGCNMILESTLIPCGMCRYGTLGFDRINMQYVCVNEKCCYTSEPRVTNREIAIKILSALSKYQADKIIQYDNFYLHGYCCPMTGRLSPEAIILKCRARMNRDAGIYELNIDDIDKCDELIKSIAEKISIDRHNIVIKYYNGLNRLVPDDVIEALSKCVDDSKPIENVHAQPAVSNITYSANANSRGRFVNFNHV